MLCKAVEVSMKMNQISKKLIVLAAILASFDLSFAGRISDFNALIDENTAAQNQLQKEITKSVEETRTSLQETKNEPAAIVVENENQSTFVETGKNLLKFKKEVYHKKMKSQDKRLANEIKSAQDLEL